PVLVDNRFNGARVRFQGRCLNGVMWCGYDAQFVAQRHAGSGVSHVQPQHASFHGYPRSADTISGALAIASGTLSASFPPAMARSGLPPPPPPTIGASWRTMSPALIVPVRSGLTATHNDALSSAALPSTITPEGSLSR